MRNLINSVMIAMVCVSIPALAKPASSVVKKKVSLKVKLVSTGAPTAPVTETPAAAAPVPTPGPASIEKTVEEKPAVKARKAKPAKKAAVRRGISVKPRVVAAAVPMVKPSAPVADVSDSTGTYEKSKINFNGLIDKSASRKTKLEKRVKAKTKGREEAQPKVASYDMDDVDMKWERAPQSEMKTPEPKSSGAASETKNFSLELIPKK